ncbi:hypothetical protein G9464_17260 [Halostella sp. JP-L12]|uniref:DUF5658 family protein n=1 Tax=Halostella TaxID=1843185 RepID=UPI000EF7E517|nr:MULTISPECIES: DUF5658 family protein [Halostella]NHN49323.1 hypothetical protein [Halostella sp. JP-L12]
MSSTTAPSQGIALDDAYAKVEFMLWTGLVALAVTDAVTTVVALSDGFTEFNLVVATLVHYLGPSSVVIVKLLYIAAAGAVWRLVDGMGRLYALGTATSLLLFIVANNLAWLLALGGGPH